jgi:hypothetical protein
MYANEQPRQQQNSDVSLHETADRTGILMRNTFRYLVVIFAVIANLIFILCDPDGFTKRYVLLVYLCIVYFLDAMLAFLSRAEFEEVQTDCNAARRAPLYHNHTTLVSNPTIGIVSVWLLWLAGSIIFYRERVNYEEFDVLSLPLFVTSAVTLVDWRPRGFFVAPFLFGIIFLLMIGFPSHTWLPQTTSDAPTILRVSAYFGISLMFEQRTHRGVTNFQAVLDDVEKQRSQNSTGEELPESIVFCTTLKLAEEARAFDYNRSMRIFAQSAWILVVSGRVFLVYAVLLFLLDISTHWFTVLHFGPRIVDRLLAVFRLGSGKNKPVLPVTMPRPEDEATPQNQPLDQTAVTENDVPVLQESDFDPPKSVIVDLHSGAPTLEARSSSRASDFTTDWQVDVDRRSSGPTSFRISTSDTATTPSRMVSTQSIYRDASGGVRPQEPTRTLTW